MVKYSTLHDYVMLVVHCRILDGEGVHITFKINLSHHKENGLTRNHKESVFCPQQIFRLQFHMEYASTLKSDQLRRVGNSNKVPLLIRVL